MKKKYSIIILLLIISGGLLLCICINSTNNNKLNEISSRNLQSSALPDTQQVEKYYQFLDKQTELTMPWISRKEIAAWSAIILYLSIIMVMLSQYKVLKQHQYFSSILLILLSILILLFIHQQYGTMVDSMAIVLAIEKIQRSIIIDKIPDYLDFSSEKTLRSSMQPVINECYKYLRQYKWYCKPFVPFIKICSGMKICPCRKITTVEVEESIEYDIILIISSMFIISMFFKDVQINKEPNKTQPD